MADELPIVLYHGSLAELNEASVTQYRIASTDLFYSTELRGLPTPHVSKRREELNSGLREQGYAGLVNVRTVPTITPSRRSFVIEGTPITEDPRATYRKDAEQ